MSSTRHLVNPHHTLGSLYKPALPICICHYWREKIIHQVCVHLRTRGNFGQLVLELSCLASFSAVILVRVRRNLLFGSPQLVSGPGYSTICPLPLLWFKVESSLHHFNDFVLWHMLLLAHSHICKESDLPCRKLAEGIESLLNFNGPFIQRKK